jgi:ribosomal protein S18
LNYKHSVAPLTYKKSTLIGELHRCNNTTTTPEARDKALFETREIFLNNGYPKSLIMENMSQLINRNFEPSDMKAKRLADSQNPDYHFYTMTLPYSSFRCSKVATQIYKILRQYTPKYRLNIAFSTIKLSNIFLPRMKPTRQTFFQSNLIYKFKCQCGDEYIGETKRLLHTRVLEHRQNSASHIHNHINNCEIYQNNFFTKYRIHPEYANPTLLREYIFTHFKIVERNLQNRKLRETSEGILITLEQPKINKQFEHRTTKLLTYFHLSKSPNSDSSHYNDNGHSFGQSGARCQITNI